MRSRSLQYLCVSAMLIAIGTAIPVFSPVKILLEPASFTLASHVAIFIAMMINPGVAVAVAVGTTAGFFLAGFPLIVVLRAASHVVFALAGALYLKRFPDTLSHLVPSQLFSLLVGVLHALCEVFVVTTFYFGGSVSEAYYQQGFFQSVVLLVGVGSLVHSMVDFALAQAVARALQKQRGFALLTGHS